MATAVLVAKIAALGYLSMGVAFLFGKVNYEKIIDSIEKSPGLSMTLGIFSIIIGMLILEQHNIWVKDWNVLVTIIGWGATIKGVLFLACPQIMFKFKSLAICKSNKTMGVIVIALGLVFGYFGFCA